MLKISNLNWPNCMLYKKIRWWVRVTKVQFIAFAHFEKIVSVINLKDESDRAFKGAIWGGVIKGEENKVPNEEINDTTLKIHAFLFVIENLMTD